MTGRCIAFLRYPPMMVGPQFRRRQCSYFSSSKSGLCWIHANVIVGELTPEHRRLPMGERHSHELYPWEQPAGIPRHNQKADTK